MRGADQRGHRATRPPGAAAPRRSGPVLWPTPRPAGVTAARPRRTPGGSAPSHPGPGAGRGPVRNRVVGMLAVLTLVTGVAALLLAAWCGWAAYRDQPTKDWHFIGMAVVSVLALVQLVIGVVALARGEKPDQGTTIFVAYLLGAFACVPAAGFMSLGERTRWGSVTAAAGGVVLAVLEVRLYDIWGG
ncbi:hypothetical protein ACE1SV_50150 [Streptomyces sennicomposti]